MSSPCRSVCHLVQAYLDGELSAPQVLEVEKHTQSCSTCAERIMLDRAMRASVREEVTARHPGAGFHARVAASLAAEANRAQWTTPPRAAGSSTFGWRNLLLVAATFAVAVPIGVQLRKDHLPGPQTPVQTAASVDMDSLLQRFADWHAHPLPPEITSANDIATFEPFVGVPVRPPKFTVVSAQLSGGRMLPVPAPEQRVAAMLQYKTPNGGRISVYFYDPRRVKTTPSQLQSRVMNSEPVYVGHLNGYAVAAGQRRGIGYAVASDLDDDENATLALAVAR
jgi:anti-sigma factor RsiW